MANAKLQASADLMQTPLEGDRYQTEGLILQELATCTKVTLRGDFTNTAVADAVSSVVGLAPVSDPNTFVSSSEHILYWMGPDELLLHAISGDAAPADLVSKLRSTLPQGRSAVVEVSDYYTVIQITGDKALQVLASGTPFDVHPREFRQGQCAQTRFGNASVLLCCQQESKVYELHVRWSFARYLWDYLCKVGKFV